MRKKQYNSHIILWVLFVLAGMIHAQDLPIYSFAVKGGFSVNDYGSDFTHFEGAFDYKLPVQIIFNENFGIEVAATISTGIMSSRNRNGLLIGAGPKILVKVIKSYFVISLSSLPTYVTRDLYRDFSIGGKFHFLSQIGFNLFMNRNISLVYNFQHISNAGFERPNPGVNFHMIGVRYNVHL